MNQHKNAASNSLGILRSQTVYASKITLDYGLSNEYHLNGFYDYTFGLLP